MKAGYVMKKAIAYLLTILLCAAYGVPAGAETLKLYRVSDQNDGFKLFQAAHPDIECVWSDQDYSTLEGLVAALLTGEFEADVYDLNSLFFDCQQVMTKGYCVDLSGSETIRNELSKMHPSIVAQAEQEGKIFAVPSMVSFNFWAINMEGWEAAGLSDADVPDTFPAFLDFLEAWTERIDENPEPQISINNRWVESLYTEYSYTRWLTEMLIENYIMQLQYAGEPLRFENDTLVSLLERVKEVGEAIYYSEPVTKGSMQLIDNVSSNRWPKISDSGIISMRVNEEQPRLIKSYISMSAVKAGTEKEALAIELLEHLVTNIPDLDRALLYREAEPVLNPNYEREYARTVNYIENIEAELTSPELDADEQKDLEISLNNYKNMLESIGQRKYDVSPEQLHNYQGYVDELYFPAPGIFFIATDVGWTLKQKEDQFAAGLLSAREFVRELDHLALMIEMENAF